MLNAVGRSVPRKDGIGKATGQARYADDLRFPGMLHGRTIRTSIPCGTLNGVHLDFDPTGFTVVDYRDIPARTSSRSSPTTSRVWSSATFATLPSRCCCLRTKTARLCSEQPSSSTNEAGEPVFDPERSATAFKTILIEKGNVEAGFAAADHIVEGTYRTGHQEHVYIEPNGVIAVPEDGGMAVYGSIQCPFYAHQCARRRLGARRVARSRRADGDGRRIRREGGVSVDDRGTCGPARAQVGPAGQDRSTIAWKTWSPRPSGIRRSCGIAPVVTRDGRLVAMDVDVILDGGAYITLTPVVLSRGCIHAAGPYRCDNTRIAARAMFTNTPPNGAFRGFGAPQTQFADGGAHRARRRGARYGPGTPARAERCSGLATRPRPARRWATTAARSRSCARPFGAPTSARSARPTPDTRNGIGLAMFWHGAGFTGSGELKLASRATVELTASGARVLTSSTEIGQGTRTMHAQIVADTLGMPYEQSRSRSPTPASSPTAAPPSRRGPAWSSANSPASAPRK